MRIVVHRVSPGATSPAYIEQAKERAVDYGGRRAPRRRPSEFLTVPALVGPVAVCGIPGHTDSAVRLAAEAAVLAVIVSVVAFESTLWLGLVAVINSLLSLNGFAEDSYGQLGWHPAVDLRAAAVLAAALALGCAARRGVDGARPDSAEVLSSEDGDR